VVESWEVNVREEERAWLTGPRARDWWTGTWVVLWLFCWKVPAVLRIDHSSIDPSYHFNNNTNTNNRPRPRARQ